MSPILRYHTLASLHDPHLFAWLDLYENAFPQEERVPVSYLLEVLLDREKGLPAQHELLAALDGSNRLLGLIHTRVSPRLNAMALYYFAVIPQQRSRGLGVQMYQEVIQRCREAGCRLLVFDLEDPLCCPTAEDQELARRRLGFYARQGACLLEGVQYHLRIYPNLPEAHLNIMAHPLQPVTAEEVFTAAQELLSDSVEKVGQLKLKNH